MAFTEFFVQSTANDLNAGSGNTDAPTWADAGGSWDGTSVYTATGPITGLMVGDFLSVYANGATAAAFVARVTAVSGSTATVSTTARCGAVPATGTGTFSARANGAWKTFAQAVTLANGTVNLAAAQNASGSTVRVNLKGGVTYTVAAAQSITGNGPLVIQGYTSSPGDLGRATIDGGGLTGNIITCNGNVIEFADLVITNSAASGNGGGLSFGGKSLVARRVTCSGHRAGGFATQFSTLYVECEAYNCNLSNSAAGGGFAMTSAYNYTPTYRRCLSHDNGTTGTNTAGFYSAGSAYYDHCIADKNYGPGFSALNLMTLRGCDSFDNAGDGIKFAPTAGAFLDVENTNSVLNGGYGLNANAFAFGNVVALGLYSNAAGATNAVGTLNVESTISYASNPYFDAVASPATSNRKGNFLVTSSLAKGAGKGSFTQSSATYSTFSSASPDLGAVQNSSAGIGSATAFSAGGPSALYTGEGGIYSFSPNGIYSGTLSLGDTSAGGTWTPSTLTWANDNSLRTATYQNPSAGNPVLTATSSGPAIANPTMPSLSVSPMAGLTLSQLQSELNARILTYASVNSLMTGVNVNKVGGVTANGPASGTITFPNAFATALGAGSIDVSTFTSDAQAMLGRGYLVTTGTTSPASADRWAVAGYYNNVPYYQAKAVGLAAWYNGSGWTISGTAGTNGSAYWTTASGANVTGTSVNAATGAVTAGGYTAQGSATGTPAVVYHGNAVLNAFQVAPVQANTVQHNGAAVVLDANNYPGVNVVDVAGSAASASAKVPATLNASDVTGNLPSDVQTIKAQAVTAAAPVTVLASVGTAATSTAQTGDSFARLGTPAGASIAADIQTRSTYAGGDTAGTVTLLTRIPSALAVSGGKVAATMAAGDGADAASVKATLGAAGAGLTNLGDVRIANLDANVSSRLAATAYTAAPTAAQNATAVWQDAAPGDFSTAGSVGLQIRTNLDAAVSTRSTFAGGAVASVTAPVTVGANNDKGGYGLAVAPPTASQIRQEMDANSAKLANLDAAVSSRSTYAGGPVAGVTGNVAGNVLGTVGAVASSVNVADKTGFVLANPPAAPADIATAFLDLADSVESGETVRQTLRLVRAVLAGNAVESNGTVMFKRKDGTSTALTVTHDASGNRTSSLTGTL